MSIHPIDPAPERILAFGPAGSGKTTNLLNIAKFSHLTKSLSKFYVIDSDFSYDRMVSGYPDIPFAIMGDDNFKPTPETRLFIFQVFEWREYVAALSSIRRSAKPGDWVSVDFIGNAWKAVQEHYVSEVFHRDIGDYFLQVRKDLDNNAKTLGALEGWVDWQVINPLYTKWINDLLFRGRYHLYCVAKSDNLSSEKKPTEDAQTRQLFARYQVKPVGQKELPYQFHTLLLTGRRDDAYTITAIKDRERDECSGLAIKNFTTDYLVNKAGWKLS